MNKTKKELKQEVKMLKSEIKKLRKSAIPITEESLIKFWDNKYDRRWDNY